MHILDLSFWHFWFFRPQCCQKTTNKVSKQNKQLNSRWLKCIETSEVLLKHTEILDKIFCYHSLFEASANIQYPEWAGNIFQWRSILHHQRDSRQKPAMLAQLRMLSWMLLFTQVDSDKMNLYGITAEPPILSCVLGIWLWLEALWHLGAKQGPQNCSIFRCIVLVFFW